jgi:hypothetical protein
MAGHFVVAPALTLTLSQRERGLNPFSLREKGGDEGKTHSFHCIRSLSEPV